VEPSNGGLGDPPDAAQARAVRLSAPGDLRDDAALTQPTAVQIVVVPAVGIQCPGLAPGPTSFPPHRRQPVDQRQELGDRIKPGRSPAGQRLQSMTSERFDSLGLISAKRQARSQKTWQSLRVEAGPQSAEREDKGVRGRVDDFRAGGDGRGRTHGSSASVRT
jgi:hypothetical protein